jgi:hypothetical protein
MEHKLDILDYLANKKVYTDNGNGYATWKWHIIADDVIEYSFNNSFKGASNLMDSYFKSIMNTYVPNKKASYSFAKYFDEGKCNYINVNDKFVNMKPLKELIIDCVKSGMTPHDMYKDRAISTVCGLSTLYKYISFLKENKEIKLSKVDKKIIKKKMTEITAKRENERLIEDIKLRHKKKATVMDEDESKDDEPIDISVIDINELLERLDAKEAELVATKRKHTVLINTLNTINGI